MRRVIGVSTHAVARADMAAALGQLRPLGLPAVELSALHLSDPEPLRRALAAVDVAGYRSVSFHAPRTFDGYTDRDLGDLLAVLAARGWPVVVHPDALGDAARWHGLGGRLLIENMDKRKVGGRTAAELAGVFDRFPEASFCFDIGHARQIDPTMTEAAWMLRRFADRLRQVHLSEVNSASGHEGVTYTAVNSFRKVAHLIPAHVPVVLETPVPVDQLPVQVRLAELALTPAGQDAPVPPAPSPADDVLPFPAGVGLSEPLAVPVPQP